MLNLSAGSSPATTQHFSLALVRGFLHFSPSQRTTHTAPSYRQRLRLVADPYILEFTMKFSHLPDGAKLQAREALKHVLTTCHGVIDVEALGQAIAGAYIAMEGYESEPADQPMLVGCDGEVNIRITTKP
ncbi:hypothetical protein ACUNGU_08795 [Serratia sp. IR-2025]